MKTRPCLFVVSALVGMAVARSAFPESDVPSAARKETTDVGYLGVIVTPVHPALSANLRDVLNPEQGLTVEDVAANSPASAAGIKVHDVLTSYDNQKLFSIEQFSKLVRSDRPGRELKLEVLREGTLAALTAKVGKLPASDSEGPGPTLNSRPFRFGPPDRIVRRFQGHPEQAREWEGFDSMSVKKLGDERFRVELAMVDSQDQRRIHLFEGSRNEIRAEVLADDKLRPAERAHLLRSLNLHTIYDDAPFPHIWFDPKYGWIFEQPSEPFH